MDWNNGLEILCWCVYAYVYYMITKVVDENKSRLLETYKKAKFMCDDVLWMD